MLIHFNVSLQACMAGVVFAKLARPKSRTNTVVFSKYFVVLLIHNDKYVLHTSGML